MADIFAIDSGSSYLKSFNGAQVGFSRAICARLRKELANDANLILNDGPWAVGYRAQHSIAKQIPDPNLGRAYHGSREQHVQICAALARHGVGGKVHRLVLSLPYSEHRDPEVRKRITTAKRYEWVGGGVDFEEVLVCPQGVGAWMWWRSQHADGQRPNLAAIVDIGSCTTDIVTLYWDAERNDFGYNHGASNSVRSVSVSTFKRGLEQRISQLSGLGSRQWGYHELMDCVQATKGHDLHLRHGADIVDASACLEAEAAEFTGQLMTEVRRVAGAWWPSLDIVVLTGGGASLVDLAEIDDARVTTAPWEANVIGQYIAAGGTPRYTGEVIKW